MIDVRIIIVKRNELTVTIDSIFAERRARGTVGDTSARIETVQADG